MTSSLQLRWFSMSCSKPCSSSILKRLTAGVLPAAQRGFDQDVCTDVEIVARNAKATLGLP
ncbi:hypothetical protein [Ruegeria arenilitoris]|uniref:hypothetical protein n=1 Tax=Ruegeria arenilitoris TaxID=1173585 RepID=UPI001C2BCABC|nr:hypothetical protein [Ruegeria arenilitoris]